MFIGHYSAAFIAATSPKGSAPRHAVHRRPSLSISAFSALDARRRRAYAARSRHHRDESDGPVRHALDAQPGRRARLVGRLCAAVLVVASQRHGGADRGCGGAIALVARPAGPPPGPDDRRIARRRLGLGLWNHPGIEIPLELVLAFGGLAWFAARTRAQAWQGHVSILVLGLAMAVFQMVNWLRRTARDDRRSGSTVAAA